MLVYRLALRGFTTILFLSVSLCVSLTSGTESGDKMANAVWASFRMGRETLQSFTYTATGRNIHTKEDKPVFESHFEIYCAFDNRQEKFRFDRWDDSWPNGMVGKTKNAVKYIRNGTKSIIWDGLGAPVIQGRADQEHSSFAKLRYFDARVIGLMPCIDKTKLWTLDSVAEAFSNKHMLGVTQTEGQYRLAFNEGNRRLVETALVIDPKRDFVVTRVEARPYLGEAGEKLGEPVFISDISYQQISDIWVPSQARLESQYGPNRIITEYAFQWHSVNKSIADKSFELDGLEAPPKALLVDSSLDKDVIVGRVDGNPHTLSNLKKTPSQGSGRLWLSLLCLFSAILIFAIVLYLRRRKGKKQN